MAALPPVRLAEHERLSIHGWNYKTWRMKVVAIIGAYGLLSQAMEPPAGNGPTKRNPYSEPQASEQARAIILLNIEDHDAFKKKRSVRQLEELNARGIWNLLDEIYGSSCDH
ncbi:hypothetical protein FOMPIDRAFT_1049386 [Fomitopsis schrenkii]|uniref:Retrotransposon Copia-like N-terminal domain-containing protein n=1 Tax=Fomitopsis schrenkii TaxID=2126942 RepID=S8ECD6_FOMSC|nr:hypothetical protein FOMPIDRAFT_1049386 [Fomitopsis schrenkii]